MAIPALRDALRSRTGAVIGALLGLTLVATSMAVPWLGSVVPQIGIAGMPRFPPLHANWWPRHTSTSWVPILFAVLIVLGWARVTARLWWPALLALLFVTTWVWTMTLASVDGKAGLASVFERRGEYVYDAQQVTSIHEALTTFIAHIPLDSPHNWHIHVAGHPPGALLFFVLVDRLGIVDPYEIGLVVVTIGCTAVVAAALVVRMLAGEDWARRVSPFLVVAPAAVWVGVSGDAVFMAVAAWGLVLLTAAATTRSAVRRPVLAVAAGLVLGYCVYLSYGLVLLAILAVAILHLARRWSPLPWAVAGALVVVAVFTAAGFSWWEAYPVLVTRYNDGIASERPYSYWVWANLAAWTFSAGLATWAAVPSALTRLRDRGGEATLAVLGCAGLLTIAAATATGMSKAEVERVWLPFTLWIVMLPALLPRRWHGWLIASQLLTALLVQHLLLTRW